MLTSTDSLGRLKKTQGFFEFVLPLVSLVKIYKKMAQIKHTGVKNDILRKKSGQHLSHPLSSVYNL